MFIIQPSKEEKLRILKNNGMMINSSEEIWLYVKEFHTLMVFDNKCEHIRWISDDHNNDYHLHNLSDHKWVDWIEWNSIPNKPKVITIDVSKKRCKCNIITYLERGCDHETRK